jgi:hypothetical protein
MYSTVCSNCICSAPKYVETTYMLYNPSIQKLYLCSTTQVRSPVQPKDVEQIFFFSCNTAQV